VLNDIKLDCLVIWVLSGVLFFFLGVGFFVVWIFFVLIVGYNVYVVLFSIRFMCGVMVEFVLLFLGGYWKMFVVYVVEVLVFCYGGVFGGVGCG
jgi:hypothetical protein